MNDERNEGQLARQRAKREQYERMKPRFQGVLLDRFRVVKDIEAALDAGGVNESDVRPETIKRTDIAQVREKLRYLEAIEDTIRQSADDLNSYAEEHGEPLIVLSRWSGKNANK